MTKQELIQRIEKQAISLNKFYQWIGYTNRIDQLMYSFKKSKKVDRKMVKLLECFEIMSSINIEEYLEWKNAKKLS